MSQQLQRVCFRSFKGVWHVKHILTPRQVVQLSFCKGKGVNTRCLCHKLTHETQKQSYLSPGIPKKLQTVLLEHQRQFWGVSVAFNKVDEERVRLAGPDRAAAEWVLRNGGSIKWTNSPNYLKDYNFLPSTDFQSYKLEEIDLTATDVIGLGFQHLKDLQHVRKIVLHGCRTIMDDAMEGLLYVKDTVEHLEISRCPMVTEKGLQNLLQLKKLKVLVIYDLIETTSFQAVVDSLRKSMPWCQFDTTDPLQSSSRE